MEKGERRPEADHITHMTIRLQLSKSYYIATLVSIGDVEKNLKLNGLIFSYCLLTKINLFGMLLYVMFRFQRIMFCGVDQKYSFMSNDNS